MIMIHMATSRKPKPRPMDCGFSYPLEHEETVCRCLPELIDVWPCGMGKNNVIWDRPDREIFIIS